jgi:hypothetical protein
MYIDEHKLVRNAMRNSMAGWSKIPNFRDLNHEELDSSISRSLDKCLRYDYGVMQWSLYVTEVLYRLQEIIDMASRRIHKRNKEEKGTLLRTWMLYNYEFYTLNYQSILDVCLILTNEVFDLGIPYRDCNKRMVCSNRHLQGTEVNRILGELSKISEGHRTLKNHLLHRGQRIKSLPVEYPRVDFDDPGVIERLAKGIGRDIGYTKTLIREIYSEKDREILLSFINNEYTNLEAKVEHLFDELLPHYLKMHHSYSI